MRVLLTCVCTLQWRPRTRRESGRYRNSMVKDVAPSGGIQYLSITKIIVRTLSQLQTNIARTQIQREKARTNNLTRFGNLTAFSGKKVEDLIQSTGYKGYKLIRKSNWSKLIQIEKNSLKQLTPELSIQNHLSRLQIRVQHHSIYSQIIYEEKKTQNSKIRSESKLETNQKNAIIPQLLTTPRDLSIDWDDPTNYWSSYQLTELRLSTVIQTLVNSWISIIDRLINIKFLLAYPCIRCRLPSHTCQQLYVPFFLPPCSLCSSNSKSLWAIQLSLKTLIFIFSPIILHLGEDFLNLS